jgi:hypothetical protein
MSDSGMWDRLAEIMTRAAVVVDGLRIVLIWVGLLSIPACLLAWLWRHLTRLSDEETDAGHLTSYPPARLRDRLDLMARIIVSRRPRTRKRRHRHRHHADATPGARP